MPLKMTILGCGPSAGVPHIGSEWGRCDPRNPKNHRQRCSLLVQRQSAKGDGNTSILVDTSPDMRAQLLAARTSHIDAVVYTHEHADHTHGIDDLRILAMKTGKPIKACMSRSTAEKLLPRFRYCFTDLDQYRRIADAHIIGVDEIHSFNGAGGEIEMLGFAQKHGHILSLGLRFGNVAYSCDLNDLPESSLYALAGLDLWIVDALRYGPPHSSHFILEDTLRWIEQIKPRQAILTNMNIELDYDALRRELPPNVEPAYDGMIIQAEADHLPDHLHPGPNPGVVS